MSKKQKILSLKAPDLKKMTIIFIRTLIVYIILAFSVRFMGKRQIGELQISEFVITLIISELASYPVMDSDIPLLYVFVPIITLVSAEIFISFLCTKSKTFRNLIESAPCILIEKGRINQSALGKVRITLEELISEVRQKGYGDISAIDYAILESNGRLSVIAKGENQPLTVGQAGGIPNTGGIAHPVITDGKLNLKSISDAGKTPEWIIKKLTEQGYSDIGEIFLMSIDNDENISYYKTVRGEKGESAT